MIFPKEHKATVAACFQSYDDDVVVLQLDQKFLPNGVEMAILGTAEESVDNPFKSFGYRRLANYQGLPAAGKIIDFAECPEDRQLQADPLMLNSQHIDSGMSGGAVLDMERDLVVGAIAETWDSGTSLKDRDTSFAVDSLVLTFAPMHLSVTDMPPPQPTQPQPGSSIQAREATAVSQPGIKLNNAPPPLPEWVGRVELLHNLDEDWQERFEGKIEHLEEIPAPTAAEPKYDRVRRVLRRYDEHLTEAERQFLEVFSAFRLPVPEAALEPVFGHKSRPPNPPSLGGTRFQSPPAPLTPQSWGELEDASLFYSGVGI